MINRGQFTKHLLTHLASFALPVGDNDAPTEAHGWAGESSAAGSSFTPWLVLAPGTASRSEGSFADPQQDWRLSYYVSSAGVSREQTEAVSDKVRDYLKTLVKEKVALKSETWALQYVGVTSIGAVQRIGSTNPPYHVQTDTYEFWLSKEL